MGCNRELWCNSRNCNGSFGSGCKINREPRLALLLMLWIGLSAKSPPDIIHAAASLGVIQALVLG